VRIGTSEYEGAFVALVVTLVRFMTRRPSAVTGELGQRRSRDGYRRHPGPIC